MQIKSRAIFTDCPSNVPMMMKGGMAANAAARPMINFRSNEAQPVGAAQFPEVKIRKDFPESWIYDTFDNSGSVDGFLSFSD